MKFVLHIKFFLKRYQNEVESFKLISEYIMPNNYKIVALAGGVGGAKMADGLAQVLQPDQLTIIGNTGDDFIHLGLRISPDLDTICYTLAGFANPDTGWGRQNETWNVMNGLKKMGMPDWFQIGDSDILTHIVRTSRFNEGWALNRITQEFCQIWGIPVQVLPMTNDEVHTLVITEEGILEFQEYFVHRKCLPVVKGFKFIGVKNSQPAPGVLDAIRDSDLVVICPSNPWVSIDPILAIPGIQLALKGHKIIAVSPIIGNHTIKGPAAKMFLDLGFQPSALAVAQHYGQIIDLLVFDSSDASMSASIKNIGIETHTTNILMKDRADRGRLAKEIIGLLDLGRR
jgi:LPPG:FO 2-phospho-L-lactate transferase